MTMIIIIYGGIIGVVDNCEINLCTRLLNISNPVTVITTDRPAVIQS